MTDPSHNEPLDAAINRRVLATLKEARSRLEAERLARNEPIAIIGMDCRFPGCDSLDEYWRLLHDGVDATGDVPADRWNVEEIYDAAPATRGKAYAKRGGFLKSCDAFDAAFFGVSPREAMGMDPQHRLLLEVSWQALEHAAVPFDTLRESRTAIFAGICQNDYARLELNSGDLDAIDAYSGTGNLLSFSAGRIAYLLGLTGAAIAVDTACSSSLVAIHLACNALRNGEADLALAGGVHLMFSPEMYVFLSMSRALSPDGYCRSFDAQANGFGRGEGCGVVVLKRLSRAIADNDQILAVIRGSAVNHNGPSSGLTVPSEKSQVEVIREALRRAGVEPRAISFVEAHGTGTALGDPIELEAIAAAYCQERSSHNPLAIGSVKTNFGHLEAAAGIASLIKVILALNQRIIPRNLHFQAPNPRFSWSHSPVVVPTSNRPWDCDSKRLAGISSFGMSGVNAHIIVEEYLQEVSKPRERGEPLLIPLSAKSPAALADAAVRLRQHLIDYPSISLNEVCATTNIGRATFTHRLAIVATSIDDLNEKLGSDPAGLHNNVFRSDSPADELLSNSDPQKSGVWYRLVEAAKTFCRGENVNWIALQGGSHCRRIVLPGYPFQRRRYWVAQHVKSDATQGSLFARRLNLPFSAETRFETEYAWNFPDFLQDHRVFGSIVVPAATHLAFAIAGVTNALKTESCILEDIVFLEALVLNANEKRTVQLILGSESNDFVSFQIVSFDATGGDGIATGVWQIHVTGQARSTAPSTSNKAANFLLSDMRRKCTELLTCDQFYSELRLAGVDHGDNFRWVESLSASNGHLLGHLEPTIHCGGSEVRPILPGMLDSCLQIASRFWTAYEPPQPERAFVPFRISRLAFYGSPPIDRTLWSYSKSPSHELGSVVDSEVHLFDEDQILFLSITGFQLRAVSRSTLLRHAVTQPHSPISPVVSKKRTPCSSPQTPSLIAALAAAVPGERLTILTDFVIREVAAVMLCEPDEIRIRDGLYDAGLDSITAVELSLNIEPAIGQSLPSTLLFDYPTIEAVVSYLSEKLEIGAVLSTSEHQGVFSELSDVDVLLAESARSSEADITRDLMKGGQASQHRRPNDG